MLHSFPMRKTLSTRRGLKGSSRNSNRNNHRFPGERSSKKRSGAQRASTHKALTLAKAPTGIQGLDEITDGGLPRGRPTLVCGGAGCGKTLMSIEFLVRGATEYGEPGVLMVFEETADELAKDVRSLCFDL